MSKIVGYYSKFIDILNKTLDLVGIILMLIMTGIIFYQVIMRQVFNNSPAWAEEVALLIMIWFVYLGVVIGIKEDLHIGIEMFVDRLPRKVAYVLQIIVNFIVLGLAYLFWYFGNTLATALWNNSLPATGLSVGYYYIIISVAGVLMALVLVGQIAAQLIRKTGEEA
jgi:TRAP-type C4-dicarboxylate transport system permease small subunit